MPHGARLLPVRAVQAWIASAGITEGRLLVVVDQREVTPELDDSPQFAAAVDRVRIAAAIASAEASGFEPLAFSGQSPNARGKRRLAFCERCARPSRISD